MSNTLIYEQKMVPRARLELARLSTLDPKSSASANFATSAHWQSRIYRISGRMSRQLLMQILLVVFIPRHFNISGPEAVVHVGPESLAFHF